MRFNHVSTILVSFVILFVPLRAGAQSGDIIDVAVYMDEGAWEDGVIAFEHFLDWKGLTHARVDADAVNAGPLAGVYRCLYVPGGYAYDYKRKITSRGERNIRELVDGGGGYIGVCAGAYFAADHVDWEGGSYPYTLGLFKGTARGALPQIKPWPEWSMTNVRLHRRHPVTSSHPPMISTLYFGGPVFIPDPGFACDTLATWEDAGGGPAIIAFPHGKGHVILFGPHPEIEENDSRDGTAFASELIDPESEWGLLWGAMDWVLSRPVTDTTGTTAVCQPPVPDISVSMNPAFPNPFSDRTSITITAPAPSHVTLTVHDTYGRVLAALIDETLGAGNRTVFFPSSQANAPLRTGVYFLRLTSGQRIQTTRLLHIR